MCPKYIQLYQANLNTGSLLSTLFSHGRINSRPSNVIVRGWRREHHMMTPTPCEVGPSLSRTQTLIATRVPCGGWREQQGSGRPFTRTRNQKRLNNGRLGGNTPRPAAFPSEGHGARKCLPSDPCTVHSHQSPHHASVRKGSHRFHILEGGKENTQPRRELQDILRRVHQNRRWPSNLIRRLRKDELRRISSKLQGRFLTKLRIAGRFGRLSVITRGPSHQKERVAHPEGGHRQVPLTFIRRLRRFKEAGNSRKIQPPLP